MKQILNSLTHTLTRCQFLVFDSGNIIDKKTMQIQRRKLQHSEDLGTFCILRELQLTTSFILETCDQNHHRTRLY